MKLSPEQLRTLENLALAYDTWMQAVRAAPAPNRWLMWKSRQGRDYLYEARTGVAIRALLVRVRRKLKRSMRSTRRNASSVNVHALYLAAWQTRSGSIAACDCR